MHKSKTISVLYLNIHTGCKESDRFKSLITFTKKENPDVLGLSELNGWERDNFSKLRRFKTHIGMQYSVFCRSPHGYHLALFSKSPLENARLLHRGMWHGAIIANVKANGSSYSITVTHLSPMTEDIRLKEVDLLIRALDSRHQIILMGDMNSISPSDIKDDDALLSRIRRMGMKKFGTNIKKFGTNKLRKEVIQQISKEHLIDTARLFSNAPGHSVPTKRNMDRSHVTPLRLDYIFVTKDLRAKVRAAGVIRTKETDNISDHYPIYAKLIA